MCPEASSEELQEALHRIGGNTFEADHSARVMIAAAAAVSGIEYGATLLLRGVLTVPWTQGRHTRTLVWGLRKGKEA